MMLRAGDDAASGVGGSLRGGDVTAGGVGGGVGARAGSRVVRASRRSCSASLLAGMAKTLKKKC